MCLPVSRTPKPGFPASVMTQMELPGRSNWGSTLGTRGGRCSPRLDSQPQGLDVCKCWGHQGRDNSGLNPPQAGEGESPRSHPSPLLLKEGLPA